MMDQNELELLSAYADREVYGDELKRLNDALATSAEYKAELKKIRAIKSLIATTPPMSAPTDLVASLVAQAEQLQGRPSVFKKNTVAWKLVGATAALVIGMGLWLHHVKRTQLASSQSAEAMAVAQFTTFNRPK